MILEGKLKVRKSILSTCRIKCKRPLNDCYFSLKYRYLCDFTYYQSLSIDKDKTAFIHVPPLNKPWGAEDLSQAVSLCTTELLRQLQDRNALNGSSGSADGDDYKLESNQL